MNYSVWGLVKARWIKWGVLSRFILYWIFCTILFSFTKNIVVTKAGEVVSLTVLQLLGVHATVSIFFTILVYLMFFIGALLVYSIIVHGAKIGARGYHQLYMEYLSDE